MDCLTSKRQKLPGKWKVRPTGLSFVNSSTGSGSRPSHATRAGGPRWSTNPSLSLPFTCPPATRADPPWISAFKIAWSRRLYRTLVRNATACVTVARSSTSSSFLWSWQCSSLGSTITAMASWERSRISSISSWTKWISENTQRPVMESSIATAT